MSDSFASPLLSPIFESAAVARIFSDRGVLQVMLDFEAALATAEAEIGIIPAAAAPAIARVCRAELYDIAEIGRAAASAGNVAIPLVKALTAKAPERARDFVHYGATSQDVIDTAFMLCARPALDAMHADLSTTMRALVALIGAHRQTLMPGRTLMQQALPITFAYAAATWLSGLAAATVRLRSVRRDGLALQFGGAAGTLAALGDKGLAVRKALAARLQLAESAISWHTERGRILDIATSLAGLSGAATKIATDVLLLMQSEVAEAFEPAAEGRGGSSTMPHKRNPVGALAIRANHRRIAGLMTTLVMSLEQEHQRGAGGWAAEWQTMRDLFALAAGSLERLREMVTGLEVDAARMRQNLDAGLGLPLAESLTFALAASIGKVEASGHVAAAARRAAVEKRPLAEIAKATPGIAGQLSPSGIERALDPRNYLGATDVMIDAALQEARRAMED